MCVVTWELRCGPIIGGLNIKKFNSFDIFNIRTLTSEPNLSEPLIQSIGTTIV